MPHYIHQEEIMIFVLLISAYFLGSIPFSVYIPKLFGINVLESGSKNPGFTNVLRTAGVKLGVICLLCDMAKGFLPAIAAKYLGLSFLDSLFGMQCLAGFFGVLGHCYSPFIGFKGGKGVAATGGLIFALDLRLVPILLSCLILTIAITKYMSVASMLTAAVFPIAVYLLYGNPSYAVIPALYTVFILIKHKSNLIRLMRGTENKFSIRSKIAANGESTATPSDKPK